MVKKRPMQESKQLPYGHGSSRGHPVAQRRDIPRGLLQNGAGLRLHAGNLSSRWPSARGLGAFPLGAAATAVGFLPAAAPEDELSTRGRLVDTFLGLGCESAPQ